MTSSKEDIFIFVSFKYLFESSLQFSFILNKKILVGKSIPKGDKLEKIEFPDIEFSKKIDCFLYIIQIDIVNDDIDRDLKIFLKFTDIDESSQDLLECSGMSCEKIMNFSIRSMNRHIQSSESSINYAFCESCI